jgi:hypothetical protein
MSSHQLQSVLMLTVEFSKMYRDVRAESCNLPICLAGLHGARSRGNMKYIVTLGFDGTVGC